MRKLNLITAALMLVSFAGAADAAGGNAALRAACQADAEKFCADQKGPARRACLQSHETELQPACSDALKSSGTGKAQ
jgi:hypothetical protein